MIIRSIPKPTIVRTTVGALDSTFAALRPATDDCHFETVAADSTVEKVRNKLSSAINSYRVRTGDKSAFSIRVIEGGVVFEGQTFGSLSEVARHITGRRWNGPRFFGLRGVNVR